MDTVCAARLRSVIRSASEAQLYPDYTGRVRARAPPASLRRKERRSRSQTVQLSRFAQLLTTHRGHWQQAWQQIPEENLLLYAKPPRWPTSTTSSNAKQQQRTRKRFTASRRACPPSPRSRVCQYTTVPCASGLRHISSHLVYSNVYMKCKRMHTTCMVFLKF